MEYLNYICKNKVNDYFTEHQLKHLHFYSVERSRKAISEHCKGQNNFHYNDVYHRDDRFFDIINKMVCETV